MGEFIAVLNGIEFRTRHNDYRLFMPSTTSDAYHATEEIPLSQVPPEVLQYTKVDDQVIVIKISIFSLCSHSPNQKTQVQL